MRVREIKIYSTIIINKLELVFRTYRTATERLFLIYKSL